MTSTGSEPQQPAAPQQTPQWAWARGPQQMRTVETEPLEYHRLFRGAANYRWWKPLAVLGLAGVFFGILTVAVSLAFAPVLMFGDPEYLQSITDGTGDVLDTQHPVSVLLSLVSIIIMIPSVLLALLVMGVRPVGRIWSVAVRIRWGLLGRTLGVAVLAVVVMNAVGIGLELILSLFVPAGASAQPASEGAGFDTGAALLSLLFIVLLVPFQAAAEEIVFRGLLMQVIGSWLKSPWFAILIPTVFFAALHIYDVWGLAAVAILGAVAAWLTWRTGGLEAAIAIHIVNNLAAFGVMVSGVSGETAQTAEGGGAGSLIGEVVGLALFVWMVRRVFVKRGYGRSRIDLIQVPVDVAPQAAAPGCGGPAPLDGPRPLDGPVPLDGPEPHGGPGPLDGPEPHDGPGPQAPGEPRDG